MKRILGVTALLSALTYSCGSRIDEVGVSSLEGIGSKTCSIQTHFNTYLTAVGGGGLTVDAIHADATKVRAWEKFTMVNAGSGTSSNIFAIKTANGRYLTAVGGGGRIKDVIHTDAASVSGWEKFTIKSLGGSIYTIQTANGDYLGDAGQSPDVMHSDAKVAGSWEKFHLRCKS